MWTHRFDHYAKTGRSKVHNIQFFASVSIAAIFFWIVKCCVQRIIKKDLDIVRRNNDKLKKARDHRRDKASNKMEA